MHWLIDGRADTPKKHKHKQHMTPTMYWYLCIRQEPISSPQPLSFDDFMKL